MRILLLQLFFLISFLQCSKKYEPSADEINKYNALKGEKDVNILIIKYIDFKKKYPKSEYLNQENGADNEISNKIFDFCLKERSLLLWEKAMPNLSGSVRYLKEDEIKTERIIYNELSNNDYMSISEANIFIDSLLPKINSKENYFLLASKEVSNLYEEIKKNDERSENQKFKNEYYAWDFVSNKKNIGACRKYLEYHPYGMHRKEVINLQVDLILKGEYGNLPKMMNSNGKISSQANVKILNSTPYKLTVLYSGSVSEYMIILAGQSKNITLKSGTYRISAYVDNYRVRNFAGIENINFSDYDVEYYINSKIY